ncbi:MAG: 2-phospho-L-lactate transferase CofD family protein [Desulfovibrionaceae bacterium]
MKNYFSQILFFSGGTALYDTSKVLTSLTRNVVHLLTPFDSGGSTAILRDIFDIPAVGDIRNRILALVADTEEMGAVKNLLDYRVSNFPSAADSDEFYNILKGEHLLWNGIAIDIRNRFLSYLSNVLPLLPDSFTVNRASIGNCVIVGAVLQYKTFSCAIKSLSIAMGIQEVILPVVEDSLYLVALLEDGSFIHGQHCITQRKEHFHVVKLYLTDEKPGSSVSLPKEISISINEDVTKYIESAQKICYSIGSFYTSLLAGLIPEGITQAIIANTGPKIYIPNIGKDFEQASMSVDACVKKLLETLKKNTSADPFSFISHVILDPRKDSYANGVNEKYIQDLGIQIIHSYCLRSSKEYDPNVLAQLLLSESIYKGK